MFFTVPVRVSRCSSEQPFGEQSILETEDSEVILECRAGPPNCYALPCPELLLNCEAECVVEVLKRGQLCARKTGDLLAIARLFEERVHEVSWFAWPKVPMSLRRARDLLGAMAAFAGTDAFEEARVSVQEQLAAGSCLLVQCFTRASVDACRRLLVCTALALRRAGIG